VRGRFPVGTQVGSPLRRRRSQLEHRVAVAYLNGMVGELSRIGRCTAKCRQRPAVESSPLRSTQVFLNRPLGELVPETYLACVDLEHPVSKAFVQRGDVTFGDISEHRRLGAWAEHRGRPQHVLCRRGEPGDPSEDASRIVAGTSSTPAARASVTKNGFPAVAR
jgi:hypothetical protein